MNDPLAIPESVPFQSFAKPHSKFGLVIVGGLLRPDGRIWEAETEDGLTWRWDDEKKQFMAGRGRWATKETIVAAIERGAKLRGKPQR